MAQRQFTDVQDRPTEFLELTSLTRDEFHQLVPPFEAAFQAHMAAWRFDGKPQTACRFRVDQHCPLPTPEARRLFILAYVKTYSLQVVQGRLFGMGQSKANQWIPVLLPVLLAALRPLGDAPARIHRQLLTEGYTISDRSVRQYVRQKQLQAAEVFVPLSYRPGELAEVDFFDVVVEERGQQRHAWKFLMHLMYSGYDFVWLYDHCDQLALRDAHVRAFGYFGGVPHRIAYDKGPSYRTKRHPKEGGW
jgi:hypothetical protein